MNDNPSERDIYMALGRLTEAAEANLRSREVLYARVEQAVQAITELRSDFNEMKSNIKTVCNKVQEMNPPIEDWKRIKQRGVGLLLGAGIAGSGVTFAIKKLWEALT